MKNGNNLLKRVSELERRIEELETKNSKKSFFVKIKSFFKKHIKLILTIFILFVCLISWEGYSLYSYRKVLSEIYGAQSQSDFDKAEVKLEKLRRVVGKSAVLYFMRKDNIETMIATNQSYQEQEKTFEEIDNTESTIEAPTSVEDPYEDAEEIDNTGSPKETPPPVEDTNPPSTNNEQAIESEVPTSTEWRLVATDGVYLGKLTTDKYDLDSIFNEYGTYGSKYSLNSIWNEYGEYGSKYSDKSAFNKYTQTPPRIISSDGREIGKLTVNEYLPGAISPYDVYNFLEKNGM